MESYISGFAVVFFLFGLLNLCCTPDVETGEVEKSPGELEAATRKVEISPEPLTEAERQDIWEQFLSGIRMQ